MKTPNQINYGLYAATEMTQHQKAAKIICEVTKRWSDPEQNCYGQTMSPNQVIKHSAKCPVCGCWFNVYKGSCHLEV